MKTKTIESRYIEAEAQAYKLLESLDVAHGKPTKIRGLSGWVFEQTVRSGIEAELKKKKIKCEISEQVSIGGRAKIDLVIGNVALEIKVSGFYDNIEEKYSEYRKRIEKKGLAYFYVTLYEDWLPNLKMAARVFGSKKVFVLSNPRDWKRLVSELVKCQKKQARVQSLLHRMA
jgi:hypothetical protein